MTTPFVKFRDEPSPSNAVALAIADHQAGKLIDYDYVDQLRKAQERLDAYPKLVEALRNLVEARFVVRASVQHFHKNRREVKQDSDAAKAAGALLLKLGEVS